MKRSVWVILVLLLAISLHACSNNFKTTPGVATPREMETYQPEPTKTPEQMADEQIPQPGAPEFQTPTTKEQEPTAENKERKMKLQVGDNVFTATLANNSSADALLKMLENGPISIDMRDYGNMEKVGMLGKELPRNDEQITTEPGDLILYQGNAFVIYYAPNSWDFTRLGKIDDVTAEDLKKALGSGDVTVTLSQN